MMIRYTGWMALICLMAGGWNMDIVQAQQIDVTSLQNGSGEWVGDTRLQRSGDMIRVESPRGEEVLATVADLSISPNRQFWGVIQRGHSVRVRLFDQDGSPLLDHELDFVDGADETLALYLLDNGTYVVRDNVANFTRHDLDGSIGVRHSNFSGATGGERPSYLVSDRFGLTSLYVVPDIQYGENRGSMVRLLKGYGEASETIHESRDRTLLHVGLSPDGRQVLMIQEMPGMDERIVELVDRFGNLIQTIESEEPWIGGAVDESGNVITLFTTSRVQSFRVGDAERLGSSTVRGEEVFYGGYCSSREEMVILTGSVDESSARITGAEIQVVSLRARSLVREPVPGGTLTWNGSTGVNLNCGETRHEINGVGRTIRVQPTF
ncbi:MAG: hypothetical protein WD115_06035 [Balneolaceae bacterium]